MKSLKGILFAIIATGTFGLIPLFTIPLMQEGLEVPSILFYRFLISLLMMGIICLIRKENLKLPKKHLLILFALSGLYLVTSSLLISSFHYIPSGMATTIHFMYPIVVSFIMVVFFKEKWSLILLLAIFIAIVGIILLCWAGTGNIKTIGVVMAVITVFTYSIYIVIINQSGVGRISAEVLTFYILLFGTALFFLNAFFTTGIQPIPNVLAFGRLSLLAFLCTVVSNFTLVLAVKLIGATTTSILGSVEPVVAVLIGVLYFSEPFGLNSLAGIILVIISVTIVVTNKARNATSNKTLELLDKE